MAIEIKELVIRAIITDDNISGKSEGDEGGSETSSSNNSADNDDKMEDIVNTCVEQVLEILEKKYDR